MPRQVRLTERCFRDGRLHEPGEVITLADGEKGPHRAQRVNHDRIDYSIDPPIDANRVLGKLEDVPLFEEIEATEEKQS